MKNDDKPITERTMFFKMRYVAKAESVEAAREKMQAENPDDELGHMRQAVSGAFYSVARLPSINKKSILTER